MKVRVKGLRTRRIRFGDRVSCMSERVVPELRKHHASLSEPVHTKLMDDGFSDERFVKFKETWELNALHIQPLPAFLSHNTQ